MTSRKNIPNSTVAALKTNDLIYFENDFRKIKINIESLGFKYKEKNLQTKFEIDEKKKKVSLMVSDG